MQPGGHRFDPGQLHQKKSSSLIGFQSSAKQRKRPRHGEPNDRGYDRKIEQYLSRMKPEELGEVLNGEKDERLSEDP